MIKDFRFLIVLLSLFSIVGISQNNKKRDSSSIVKKDKKVKLVPIPIVNYSNSFGMSGGLFVQAFYKTSKKDTISPLSSSGIMGTYSTNDTWFVGQMNKFYLNEDKIRIKTFMGGGSINFQTFVSFPLFPSYVPITEYSNEDDGEFIAYNNSVQVAVLEVLRRVVEHVYLGGRVVYSHSVTTFDIGTNPEEEINQLGIGISTEYDSRNNQLSPKSGDHANIKTLSYSKNLGSTNSYTNINLVYNHYFPIKERNTLLARFYSDISTGDVPFAGQNIVGRDDLRGYSSGKYRGDQVYAGQSEYRHLFSEKWGYVAFGGVATAINTAQDLQIGNLLPAVGAGIRFLAIPSANISIGIDVAVGKDDWGLYFRIGEAFTR